ncbi:MAG: glycosyltransferase family 2 protein [Nanoarchaeota archaeon]
MKLVINIPCYNEEKTLPLVLNELPTHIEGISSIEIQIVDDGSSDKTVEVAEKHGCRVLKHDTNKGLGIAFKTGMDAALERGADIFVNTDADNQYPSKYIPNLVRPVIDGKADLVIGNRKPWKVRHFSPIKRFFQYWGNLLTRKIAGSDVPDTVSGFRAYSREALLKLTITTKFSYVLDTIVQAGKKDLRIMSVPVTINKPTRKSRLFKNIFQHMKKSAVNILRVYALYEPFKTFLVFSAVFALPGLFLLGRFFYYYLFVAGPTGKVQSLIIATILLVLSGMMFVLGVIADLIGNNRKLTEEMMYRQKKEIYKRR